MPYWINSIYEQILFLAYWSTEPYLQDLSTLLYPDPVYRLLLLEWFCLKLPYKSLSVAATLIAPVGFSVMIVGSSADSDPVTANFYWTALDNVTFGDQNITYTVTASYQNGSEFVSQSIPHPSSSLEIPGLPACANLTATLVAERGSESSNGTDDQFMTSEPTGERVSIYVYVKIVNGTKLYTGMLCVPLCSLMNCV